MPLIILLGLGACSQYEFYTQSQVDFFQQISRNTVDILLVVDNSCSMIEEQTKLGDNFDSFIQYFEASESDYQIAAVTTDTADALSAGRMLGGDDEIVLRDSGGSLIDSVAYDRSWGIPEGVAMSLDPGSYSPGDNDRRSSWCLASEPYGAGDLGSPGAPGPSCAGAAPPSPAGTDTGGADTGGADTGGADTGASPREPRSGEVLITEFLPDPAAVSDALGEWVELFNASEQTLSLAGCRLGDSGRNDFALPEGLLIAPGEYLVIGRSDDGAANGGLDVVAATGGAFTLQNDTYLLTAETEGAAEIFAEMVAVGTAGAGLEMGLEGAHLALSEPRLSEDNAGFLRDEAKLSLIFVSDEDDMSPYALDDYERFFVDLKGEDAWRDPQLVSLSAVVGDQPPAIEGQPSCSSASGEAAYGSRYVELAGRTGGRLESICEDDFSGLAEDLGLLISGLTVEFVLSDYPDEGSLSVALYETADEGSLIAELERGIDYSYVIDRNAIRFEEEQLPPPESWIRVEYELLATGASNVEEEPSR